MSSKEDASVEPKRKRAKIVPVDHDLFNQEDLWVNGILPFVGPLQFLFVAGVSRKMKKFYEKYFLTIPRTRRLLRGLQGAKVNHTSCRIALSHLSTAKYWECSRGPDFFRDNDYSVGLLIAKAGNVQVLKWAYEVQGFPLDQDITHVAARSGNLAILQYLVSKGFTADNEVSIIASRNGDLEMIKWYREQVCCTYWDEYATDQAASNGHLEVLKYLDKCELHSNWNDYSMIWGAAGGGHLEVVKWLRARGCPWTSIATYGAAEQGHLEVLEWALENGCPCSDCAVPGAARNGHLSVLKLLCKNGCQCDDSTCVEAVRNGNWHVVKWLHEMGYLSNRHAGLEASIDISTWLHEHGFAWDERCCRAAAGNGDLDTLKWLRENGCPWDKDTTRNARLRGQEEILKYALENGCPDDP